MCFTRLWNCLKGERKKEEEPKGLTEEEIKELSAVFILFGTRGKRSIYTRDLGIVMTSLNQNPSEHDLQDMIREVNFKGNDTIEFDEFLRLLQKWLEKSRTDEELKKALKEFSRIGPACFNTPNELRRVTEERSDDEVKDMMQELTVDEYGEFNLKELKEAFNLFDRDRDGSINIKELGTVMKSLNLHPLDDELKDMMTAVDLDGSGTIDFNEFVRMMENNRAEYDRKKNLKQAFRIFDRDGTGLISADELRHVMSHLGVKLTDEQVKEMIREADMDGDGEINYEEFERLVTYHGMLG